MTERTEIPKFEWMPCVYNLVKAHNNKTISFNLSSSVALTDPYDPDLTPELKVDIDMEKPLIYSEELGWNWHKSWNLPPITLNIKIKSTKTGCSLKAPKKLFAEIFAAKAVIENIENFHLVEIELKGNNKVEVQNEQAFFNSLKFSSTSYNNDSAKFHLVVYLYLVNDKEFPPKILTSLISSPIFVDSRKSARDTQKIRAKKISSHIDPFLPDNLEKIFIKRQNKKKGSNQEEIENNLDGLANYFTAPNIRHKVKHPLFLAIKFSNCVSLFCNKNIFTQKMLDNLIESLQNLLYESQIRSKFAGNLKIEEKPIILALRYLHNDNYYKNTKLIDYLETINSNIMHIVYDIKIIPSNFIQITNIAELKGQYKKQYSMIASSKFKFAQVLKSDNYSNQLQSEYGNKNSRDNSENESDEEGTDNDESYKKNVNAPNNNNMVKESESSTSKTDDEEETTENMPMQKATIKKIANISNIDNSPRLEAKLIVKPNLTEHEPLIEKKIHINPNNFQANSIVSPKREFQEPIPTLIKVDKVEPEKLQTNPLTFSINSQPVFGVTSHQTIPNFHFQQPLYNSFMVRPTGFINPYIQTPGTPLSNEELLLLISCQRGLDTMKKQQVAVNTPMGIYPGINPGICIDPKLLLSINQRVKDPIQATSLMKNLP